MFEVLRNLINIGKQKKYELEVVADWKDLYDFLFGQFHMKNFSSLA